MSNKPDQYPIEGGIVPLVYVLYSMRLIIPCWSCEGHVDTRGDICKLPKVWFYAKSPFFPKLIAQAINDMQAKKKIDHSWGVRVLPFSQSLYSTTYSLEASSTQVPLPKLRNDIVWMGRELRHDLILLAQNYIR